MNIKELINKAIRSTYYRKTPNRVGGIIRNEIIINRAEGITIDHCRKTPTASWSFVNNKHKILVGTKCIQNIANANTQGSAAESVKLLKEVIKHEVGHALYTDKTNKTFEALRSRGIPFTLFNLFEDCRIEYLIAKNLPQYGRFYWHRYIDFEERAQTPSEALYYLKQMEAMYRVSNCKSQALSAYKRYMNDIGSLGTSCDYYQSTNSKGKPVKMADGIIKYYIRYCEFGNTLESQIEIIECWVKSFGVDIPKEYKGELLVNGKVDPNAKPSETINRTSETDPISNVSFDKITNRDFPATLEELQHAKRISQKLSSIVRKGSIAKNKLAQVGSKLNIAKAITRNSNCFNSSGKNTGKRKVAMLVDFSGSMRQTWSVNGGKEFVSAFSLLAKSNLIKLDIVISYNNIGYNISNHDISDILEIYPNGNHEALDTNLKRYWPLVQKANTVILFTDGMLTGNIVNESQYRSKGIDLIAACIPNARHLPKIREACNGYFSKTIMASNANDLSQKLISHIVNK
jgi:hypothetical protein